MATRIRVFSVVISFWIVCATAFAAAPLSTSQGKVTAPSPVSSSLPTPAIASAEQERQLKLETRISWAASFEALFTFALAVISYFLAKYTFRLWSSTEDTTKKQLRAFLGVNEGDRDVIFNTSGNMTIPEVLLHLTNYGRSIATNVRVFHRVLLLNHPIPQQIDFNQDLIANEGVISVFPSQDHVITCKPNNPGGFGQGQVQQFLAPMGTGSLKLMVYGHIVYNDGFDERRTNYAYTIIWREPDAPRRGKPGFFFYTQHNDAT